MTDRRSFLGWLGAMTAAVGRSGRRTVTTTPIIEAHATSLYQQPDGRNNLLRVTVSGLDAPAARARVIDRRGTRVGTAGLLPTDAPTAFAGEVWVPLSGPADFEIEIEVGKQRVARARVHVVPPRRWTLYWLAANRSDIGATDLQERSLEIHRVNLDAALTRLGAHPESRWTAETAYQVISYVENRSASAAEALIQAIRDGKVGFHALFANQLNGLLDHETYARMAWPAGLLARERGLAFTSASVTGVPGQPLTFPTLLAASGVRYLATAVDAERAVPLLDPLEAGRYHLGGPWTNYPQLYWWEGPDGSKVLHWRGTGSGAGVRFGFDEGPEAMARRLSDWLQTDPVLLSPAYPYDVALLYGAQGTNTLMDERLVENVEEFNRRFAFPKIVPARSEEFFREIERRYGTKLPVRRGDTGLYKEDGAASTAAELARFRQLQLGARAAELLALWDDRTESGDRGASRIRDRAGERRAAWQDLLLFGEHSWGGRTSVSDPDGRQTVAQWEYKRRYLDSAGAAIEQQLVAGLLRIGTNTEAGAGRIVFNASSWPRSDVVQVRDGAGKRLTYAGHELTAVDLPDGSALVVVRDVPPLGYLRLTETDRPASPPTDDGQTLDAEAGGFRVTLDPASGAIRSLKGPDGKERVNPTTWSGLNQVAYVAGGGSSALWTEASGEGLGKPPDLYVTQSNLVGARRERLLGIGVRLVAERTLAESLTITSTVTLYDELPWIDIENHITKPATLAKEALYVAFPFALTKPTVEVEVPLGRMTVERDQQPGSGRDWYCHTHWVWLHAGADGMLWSGPDTPLFTLNDVCRGLWRRRIDPDGTLFAYAMNNYWPDNFAARQGGELRCRFRLSLLASGGDPGEPVRRGWAASDPLYVSARFTNTATGPLKDKDSALALIDPGAMVLGAKRADDGEGVIVKLLDVVGMARQVGVWPAAYSFARARTVDLVERNRESITVAADQHATLNLRAWGVAAARLFGVQSGSR